MQNIKIPPHDENAEKSVLGSILLDNGVLGIVLPVLSTTDFYSSKFGTIFDAMILLGQKDEPIDAVTLGKQLKSMKKWKEVGGAATLMDVIAETPTSAHALEYAKIIHSLSVRRQLLALSYKLSGAVDGQYTNQAIIKSSIKELLSLNKEGGQDTGLVAEAIHEFITDSRDKVFMKSGIFVLDNLITGLKRGRVMVVGGSTGSGKSSFCLDFGLRQVLEGHKVLIFSTELNKSAILTKLIGYFRFHTGASEEEAIASIEQMDDLRIYTELRTVQEISMEITREHKQKAVDLVIVDHLQDLDTDNYKNEYEMLRIAALTFKDLAIEKNIAVVLASQINRASVGAKKSSEVYGYSGSGKIEQIAHIALVIHRDRDDESKLLDTAFIMVKKCRSDGSTGLARVRMQPPYYLFEDMPKEIITYPRL